jgi:hypothetical protein
MSLLERLLVENPEIVSEFILPWINDALSFCRFAMLSRGTWDFVRKYITTHLDIIQNFDRDWHVLGQRHGKCFIHDGNRRISCIFINERAEGRYIETRDDHHNYITTIITYCKRGLFHGSFVKKINDEHTIKQCTYYEGYKHGKCIHYFITGDLRRISNYVEGCLVGKLKKYDYETYACKRMLLSAVVKYRNGNKHGSVKKYYTPMAEERRLRAEGQCRNGLKVGKWVRYKKSGGLRRIDTYDDDKPLTCEN